MSMIFISYARKDKDEVYPIVDEIERNGFDCWIDKNGIESGSVFKKTIISAINECDVFVYMFSKNAFDSEWVDKEYNQAKAKDKHIIPVMLKGTAKNEDIMFDFRGVDYIDTCNENWKDKLINDLRSHYAVNKTNFIPANNNKDLTTLLKELNEKKEVLKNRWTSLYSSSEKDKSVLIQKKGSMDSMKVEAETLKSRLKQIEALLDPLQTEILDLDCKVSSEEEKLQDIQVEIDYINRQIGVNEPALIHTNTVNVDPNIVSENLVYHSSTIVELSVSDAISQDEKNIEGNEDKLITAAENGDANACKLLAKFYERVKGSNYSNKLEVEKWYRRAADLGDAEAIFYVGENLEKSPNKSFAYYIKAANLGFSTAQYRVGSYLFDGIGCKKNLEEAVYWLRKAADQGNAEAQVKLGRCYDDGEGVPKDYITAARWYKKAADQENAEAQNCLGVCYAEGTGVAKDISKAMRLIQKAADQGYKDAIDNLYYLKNTI